MREGIILVALAFIGCGGKLAAVPTPITDAAPPPVEVQIPDASTTETAEDGGIAVDDVATLPVDDAEISCELEYAPGVSLQEYANRLCQALTACAGVGTAADPFGGDMGSLTGPGGSGCTTLIVSRAVTQQIRPSCLNACALYLQSVQQGGPSCQALLQGGPRECIWAVEATFTYCSRSQGRLPPADAVGQSDGVWCPSDEQCVTIVPADCPPPPPPGTAVTATCTPQWSCLN
jgi:hypothetical protein